MQSRESRDAAAGLPAGYRAVPLRPEDVDAPVRICLVVHQSPDAVGGPFVLIRDLADASIYLGCLADGAGHLHEWLEIWVQNIEGLAARPSGQQALFTNKSLDDRWAARASQLRDLDPQAVSSSGWEKRHPLPLFFDLGLHGPLNPVDRKSGRRWELCTDDGPLVSAGLPPYGSSLCRYLWIPDDAGQPRFVPVSPGAPENAATVSAQEAIGSLLPFNPAAGLMLTRTLAPLDFESWVDLLSGKAWRGIEHGKKAVKLEGVYRTLQDASAIQQGAGHLFLGRQGRAGRLVESFHLKLHTLATMLRLVRSLVQVQQVPFLNIGPDTFRFRLADTDTALPFLWTAQASLGVPGDAVALPLESTEARYFMPARAGETSIYRPATLGGTVSGRGTVRIRKVHAGAGEMTWLEGTLVTQEKIAAAANDLLWMRLTLPLGRVDLYGHIEASDSLARGEARFRTVTQSLPPAAGMALQAAEGVPFSDAAFETIPLLSTPCDLYALGVLAVRTLLVDDELSLAVALDEVLSLGKLAANTDPSVDLGARLAAIAESDPRWIASIGPHRLLREDVTPEEGMRLMPAELWWGAIAIIIQLFPGLGGDSVARDFGDAPALAIEKVFDLPLGAVEDLIVRSRSLVVIDWSHNREIRSVIDRLLQRH